MKTTDNNKKKSILTVINAGATAATLFLGMQMISDVFTLKDTRGISSALFFTLALVFVLKSGLRKTDAQKKTAVYFVVMAVLLALSGVFFAMEGFTDNTFLLGCTVYYISLFGNRILAIAKAKKHRALRITINVLVMIALGILYFFAIISTIAPKEELAQAGVTEILLKLMQVVVLALPVIIRALGHMIALSFLRIKVDVLKKIIHKTFAAEILFGLIMLIIAFSFILQMFDPSFQELTYGDALWYCFAIVTTIGFGDMTATSVIGRILSVILGIYGIIVVALITSIIVNFYSEVKTEPEQKPADDEEDEEDAIDI